MAKAGNRIHYQQQHPLFNYSQLGSVAFNLPYNMSYRKKYLTNWDADFGKHPEGSDEGSGSKHEATNKVWRRTT